MLRKRTLNEIILDLQWICNNIGNYPVESFGATSDGQFSVSLWIDSEQQRHYIDAFERRD